MEETLKCGRSKKRTELTLKFSIPLGTKNPRQKSSGLCLSKVRGTSGSYTLAADDLYVRAKIISSKLKENPYPKLAIIGSGLEQACVEKIDFRVLFTSIFTLAISIAGLYF